MSAQNWYCLAKTVAEKEAWLHAKESGLDIVTICPSIVIGPMLQSTANASSLRILRYMKGFILSIILFTPRQNVA